MVSIPALGVVAVLTDGQKQFVALELCAVGETFEAWKGCLEDLTARGLTAPGWCVIDGHPGLRKAVGLVWPQVLVQRCTVHKLRNLERKAPKHALAEIRADFHRIVYAESAAAARAASTAFERKWARAVRVTQGALPTEDAALVLLFGLVVSGQIRLRRLDEWRQIPAVLRERRRSAA